MTNTGKIERAAVRAVDEYLDKCPKLEPYINTNDKTPIYDGSIYVYNSNNHKIGNYFATVPLQVKGTTTTKNSYRIGREFIEGYKKDDGCVFFFVQESINPSKILYAILTPAVLDLLLQQTTKTIKIDLNPVPSDPLVFEKELYAFAANRNSKKVEQTSPKEIQELVEGFEALREHIKVIKDKNARIELESSLDFIKNLKDESAEEKDTIGWRDKFYFFSRKAIDLAINNIKGHDFADLQFKLGYYLQDQKQYHLAEDYYLKSLDEYRKRSDIENVAATLNNLAILHNYLVRYDNAEEEFMEALEIRRELSKINRDAYIGNVAQTLNNLAALHCDLSLYCEAEEEFKEALEIRREFAQANRGAYIGYVADTLNNLAVLYYDLNRYDEAEKEHKEALKIRRELANANRNAYIGNVAMTLNNLGLLHNNLSHYDEAEKEYKEALETYRELAKTNRDAYIGDVATTLNNLGNLHRFIKRYDDAKTELNEALEIRRELTETNRDAYVGDVAMTLYNIALLQDATNCKDEAKKTAEEALKIYKELAKDYPQIWNSWVEKTEQLLSLL